MKQCQPEPIVLPVVAAKRRVVSSFHTAVTVERYERRPRLICGGCSQIVELGRGDRFCGYCGVRLV
jgi:rRNA maturation endonuclease Nob1